MRFWFHLEVCWLVQLDFQSNKQVLSLLHSQPLSTKFDQFSSRMLFRVQSWTGDRLSWLACRQYQFSCLRFWRFVEWKWDIPLNLTTCDFLDYLFDRMLDLPFRGLERTPWESPHLLLCSPFTRKASWIPTWNIKEHPNHCHLVGISTQLLLTP